MSLNTAFMNGGMLLASLIGGFTLNTYGFQVLGLVLGIIGGRRHRRVGCDRKRPN
jgi:predicted MFS family arabinose efflux permease